MIRVGLSKVRALHQQNVLIVDDLDRLDPEHIFRILNILSVHQDFSNGGNKFGFDKIIVVCDLANIKKIYEHKYGEKVDFRGYIEKFYSTSVFKFSNTQALAMYCQSDLTSNLSYEARIILGVYLNFFVNADKAKIRSIIKHRIKTEIRDFRLIDGQLKDYDPLYQYASYGTNSGPASYKNGPFHIDSSDFEIIPVIKVLINIFGGFQELLDVIKETQNSRGSIVVSRYRAQAIKVLGPLQFLTENMNTPEMLTAIVKEHPEYPHYSNYKLIQGPSISLYGITVPLTLKWNKEQPYTEDQSFYYNEIGIVDMDMIRTQIEKTHKSNLDVLKMNDLLSTLEGFLNFFRNQDLEDALA